MANIGNPKGMEQQPHKPTGIWRYQLTSKDVLAWETLPGEIGVSGKIGGLTLAIIAGLAMSLLPEALVGTPWQGRFVISGAIILSLAWLIFRGGRQIVSNQRARRAMPKPLDVTLEAWGDHLHEHRDGGNRTIAVELIAQVLETPDHVFVRSLQDLIIIPAYAFESLEEKRVFAAIWEAKSRNAAP